MVLVEVDTDRIRSLLKLPWLHANTPAHLGQNLVANLLETVCRIFSRPQLCDSLLFMLLRYTRPD